MTTIRLTRILLFYAFLMGLVPVLQAQPDIEWSQSYGGSFSDIPNAIAPNPNGGALVAGVSFSNNYDVSNPMGKGDGWIIRVGADNAVLWANNYGSTGQDAISDIVPATDNGYVAVGYTTMDVANAAIPVSQAWIFKIDENGTIVWEQKMGETNGSEAVEVLAVGDGYLVLGNTSAPNFSTSGHRGATDAFLMKIDNNGNAVWTRRWGGYASDFATDMTLLPNGNIAVCGYADSPYNNYKGALDGWVSMLNADGQLVWSKYFGGTFDDELNSIAHDNNGNIYVGGFTYSDDEDISENFGLRDSWLIQIDATGALNWSKTYGGSLHEAFQQLLFYNNELLAGGYTESPTGSTANLLGQRDFWLAQIDNNGNIGWETNYGGDRNERLTTMVVGTDNSLYMAGHSETVFNGMLAFTKGLEDFFVLKTTGTAVLPLSVELGADQAICFGNSINLNASITNCNDCQINWNDGLTTATRTVTPAVTTTYSITIMDNTGQTAVDEVTVNVFQNPTIDLTASANNLCAGETVNIQTAISNCMGCNYEWNTGSTDADLTDQPNIDTQYNVTVTNNGGCTASAGVFLTVLENIIANPVTTDISCFGLNNGRIELNILQNDVDATWNNGMTIPVLNNLSPGNYTVSLTGSDYCDTELDFTIIEPSAINAVIFPQPVTCAGLSDGRVNTTVSGGTPPYDYQWSNGTQTSTLSNLPPGFYSLNVADANGCIAATGTEITSPSPINLSATLTDVSCSGDTDGSISISTQGGSGNYTYLWSNGVMDNTITGIGGELYTLVVTDDSGCSTSAAYSVNEPAAIIFSTTINNPTTGNADGSILAVPNGGTPPYTYAWNTGATGFQLNNLEVGMYALTVTDSEGCSSSIDFNLVVTSSEDWVAYDQFDVLPNPTNGLFSVNLAFSEQTIFKLSMINALGQPLWEQDFQTDVLKQVFAMERLESGIYFVVIETASGIAVKRVVIVQG